MMGSYNILKLISKDVALVQLMKYLGNVNHDIGVVGYWIFYSNYKIALVINKESFDMICAPSVSEKEVAEFESVFTAVKYIFSTAHLKKE